MSGIYDSGSNANGNYIRYSDGTMVQWYSSGTTVTAVTTAGLQQAYTYPIPFLSGTLPSVSAMGVPAASIAGTSVTGYPYNAGGDHLGCAITVTTGANQNFTRLGYTAIGKWSNTAVKATTSFPTATTSPTVQDLTLNGDIKSGRANSGDISIGVPYYIGYANRNATTLFVQASPVSGTVYTVDCSGRVPSGAKAVIIRWWIQHGATTVATDWYWAGFYKGDDATTPGDAATIAVGSELTGANTYHHETLTVPLSPSRTFKVIPTLTGTYANINCNVIGYYI